MASPQLDIATYIATNIAALTLGTNCFASSVAVAGEGIPDKAAFVTGTGGFPTITYRDGGNKTGLKRPSVQIWVRSDVEDLSGGLTLVRSVHDAIDMASITGYIEARATTSEPIYLGRDDANHHEWSINVNLIKEI